MENIRKYFYKLKTLVPFHMRARKIFCESVTKLTGVNLSLRNVKIQGTTFFLVEISPVVRQEVLQSKQRIVEDVKHLLNDKRQFFIV